MAIAMIDGREQKGQEIAKLDGQIQRIDDSFYTVKSQSGHGVYEVLSTEHGWICGCPDFIYREVKCKHIYAVEFSEKLRKEVQARKIEPITDVSTCIYCGSTNIVRDGVRKNKYGDIQKFNCKACGRYFTFNLGFEKMKHNPKAVTTAKQLYFS
ncbi:MAG: putative transposase [Thermoproteota archaeon]|nr:putative transposase [Thermoproteota archaeon]